MWFCWDWSRECGLHGRGWVGPTVLLCIYGFCSMMRPSEPFLTDYLTGPYKNLTTKQVTKQVFPIWAYSNLFLLIPTFLVTDILRYKPVIVLQALNYILAFLLFIFSSGVVLTQFALFIYSMGTAADVAYYSYIYSVVHPQYYQRVTSYARGAVLLGYAAGAMLGQLLVSLGGVSIYWLNVITLGSLCVALLAALLLPMPQRSLVLGGTQTNIGPFEEVVSSSCGSWVVWWLRRGRMAGRGKMRALKRLAVDCKECYSSVAVLFFCVWSAMGKCGYHQITGYVQILWAIKQPQYNFTEYNGGVEAVATLSGAAASIVVGHVALDWSVWGELVLGVLTALTAGVLYLMDLTNSIWICYGCYGLFKTIYMELITMCTFQIAQGLSRERYALVFGVNSFVGMALQSLLTAIVVNTKSLQLTITSQFFVYASYFAAMAVLFLIRGVYTLLQSRLVELIPAEGLSERRTDLPQVSPLA
ncbi:thiamine transporter 2-like [Coregonus clupeaformis]|uniref:thiamine transporter 2-like n=1 Tax=Coregonus clupeaformis TaxID=59861 RepID=UPI001E1C941A|nr:thiamine transporter 2-like [Coregonus clupeaformis]